MPAAFIAAGVLPGALALGAVLWFFRDPERRPPDDPFALVEGGQVPADGRGLNPLLQNFWMQIHPPILFFGFASMTPPFALAIAALIQKKYQDWVVSSLPWVVGGAMVLGLGISLGGFWAYETLGWGGWWGWDPVENSSLLPWLVSVSLVHTMLTQKRTKGLIMTNFILAILAFVMVLYSTFLTRSVNGIGTACPTTRGGSGEAAICCTGGRWWWSWCRTPAARAAGGRCRCSRTGRRRRTSPARLRSWWRAAKGRAS